LDPTPGADKGEKQVQERRSSAWPGACGHFFLRRRVRGYTQARVFCDRRFGLCFRTTQRKAVVDETVLPSFYSRSAPGDPERLLKAWKEIAKADRCSSRLTELESKKHHAKAR